MNPSARRPILIIASAFAVALSFGPVACGGDDNGGSGGGDAVTIDPNQAEAASHAALITEKDLPGSGWTVTKQDEFSDDDQPLADTATCKSLAAKQKAAREKAAPGRKGRAEVEYSHDNGDNFDTSVEVEVNVFGDTKVPAAAFASFKAEIDNGDFEKCLKDATQSGFGQAAAGVTVAAKSGARPGASAPGGGLAQAYEFVISAGGQSLDLRLEAYAWRFGNVGVTVTISGPNDLVPADLAKQVLSRVQVLLDKAKAK